MTARGGLCGLALTLTLLGPLSAIAQEDPLALPGDEARRSAIAALSERGGLEVAVLLARVVEQDPNPVLRGAALRGLLRLDLPSADLTVARAGQRDPDLRVRALSASLLGQPPPGPSNRPPELFIGATLGATSYGGAIIVGVLMAIIGAAGDDEATTSFGLKLLIPGVGPILSALTEEPRDGTTVALMTLTALIEVTAAVLLVVGLRRRATRRAAREAEQQAFDEETRLPGLDLIP